MPTVTSWALPFLAWLVLLVGGCRTGDAPTAQAPMPAVPAPVANGRPAVAPPRAGPAPTEQSASAAYDARQWDLCGEQYTALASTPTSLPRWAILFNAGCCYARGGNADLAFARMNEAVTAGLGDVEGTQRDKDLASLHGDPRWPALLEAIRRSNASLKAPELRTELLALFKEDQDARSVYVEKRKRGEKADWAPVEAIDAKTTEVIRRAIATYGWPGKSVVGDDGAHAAFLLVQHSRDLKLQKDALAQMKPLLETGEVSKSDYPYLEDRVAVSEHRKQRYGTQFRGTEPQPIEDEANVDARRKEMGLGTMAEYRESMRQMYGSQWPTD